MFDVKRLKLYENILEEIFKGERYMYIVQRYRTLMWKLHGIAYSIDVKLIDDNYNVVETMETRTLANGGVWVSFPDWNMPHRVERLPRSKRCFHLCR